MKVIRKPISSPSRTEKFPPPLMRFLSSSSGSKSRGRSRSSALFFRKKNVITESQEPSSPKVTCIGQVRVRRCQNSGKSRPSSVKCPNFWFPKNLFCSTRKPNVGSFRPICRKWVSFFRFGYCRKDNVKHDSPESNRRSHYESEEINHENEEESPTEILASSTPPKNAFLLTRCRSAPYKCSSFPTQFSDSSPAKSETEENSKFEEEKIEKPQSSPRSKISVADSREIVGIEKQIECIIINGRNSSQSLKEESAALLEPLILTRCKSEPAKTGERLVISL